MCGGDETVLFFCAIDVEQMTVGDKFLAPSRGFFLIDVLVHDVGWEVYDLKGGCAGDGGIMPFDCLAD